MSIKGVVKKWVIEKGFGFIEALDGSGDMFVHYRQIQGGKTTLNVGENVTYTTGIDRITGKMVAENVVGDGSGVPAPPAARGGFGGRGGFAGRGRGRGVCFAFQRGTCTFGAGCRFTHEATAANGGGGYGAGPASGGAYGGQGRGVVGQGNGAYASGVPSAVAPQARFFPYGGQAQSYGQQVAAPSYGKQGGGSYSPQVAAGTYGQQGAVGSYGQQPIGYKGPEQSSSYQQQRPGGYPQQQGAVSGGYAPKPAGVASFGQQGLSSTSQGGSAGKGQDIASLYRYQAPASSAQANLGNGQYQQF